MLSSRSGLGFRRKEILPNSWHLQDKIYSEVGQEPPTNSWVAQLRTDFEAKAKSAQFKALARQKGEALAKKGDSASSRQTSSGPGKEGQFIKLKKLTRPTKKDESQ